MTTNGRNPAFPRMLSDFVRLRASHLFPPRDLERLRLYLVGLVERAEPPPARGVRFDWAEIAKAAGVDPDLLSRAKDVLKPGLEALRRDVASAAAARPARTKAKAKTGRTRSATASMREPRTRPPVDMHPEPTESVWDEPDTFHEALALHMRRHRDTSVDLRRAIVKPGETLESSTINTWRRGLKAPQSAASFQFLTRIERRYRLPKGYFKAKLPHPARATTGLALAGISPAEQRRLGWHLPEDFHERPRGEQEEILEWVRRVVISGSTEYRRYQADALKLRYAVRFPALQYRKLLRGRAIEDEDVEPSHVDPELLSGVVKAPPALAAEMAELVSFKTATLTPLGYQRRGVWGDETAAQKVEHLGLMFGALAASPRGAVRGCGVPLRDLTFGLLVFPAVWDWYVQWRERRRGFYTTWEVEMLSVAVALTSAPAGWIAQSPKLADRLSPIPGLVSPADIDRVRSDWPAACAAVQAHALARAKEIQRVARVHRDPFEPILAVLESDSPAGQYRRIADEIVSLMPDGRRYPKSQAEAVRSLLLIRFGLHLGLRQRNLRQLLVCPRGQAPMTERQLEERRRGELRWSERDRGWEVLIPAAAFKNSHSSFFGGRPFRLVLPDLGGLYGYIDDWHRAPSPEPARPSQGPRHVLREDGQEVERRRRL